MFYFLLFSHLAHAHGGRTDSKGGHNGPGGYHYHSTSSSHSTSNLKPDYSTPHFKHPHIVKKNCTSLDTIQAIDVCITRLEDLQDLENKMYSQSKSAADLESHRAKIMEYEFTLMQLDAIREQKVTTRFAFVSLGIGIAVLFITALALG